MPGADTGTVARLPTPLTADAAWERYRTLAIAGAADPHLLADRAHMEATIRAERDFKEAVLALDAAAGERGGQ